jgi:hypothetical protein
LFQHAGAYTSHVSEFLNRSEALFAQPETMQMKAAYR